MKTLIKSYCLFGAALLGLNAGTLHAQTTFVNCGAVSTNVGAQLKFVNGTNYAASSGYAQPLVFQRFTNHFTGVAGSFYYTTAINNTPGNLLFQALSAKTNTTTAAAYGSYLACKVLSVTGPAGGVFSFWESSAGWPTFQFPVGGTYDPQKNWFEVGNLENGAGSPGGDPFGSIPNRRMTVNKAGEYLVTFQLFDMSKNHPTSTSSPVQAPSDPITIKFTTGVDLTTTRFAKTNGVVTMTFKQSGMTNLFVESATDINGSWTPVAGPFASAPVGTNTTVMKFTNNLAVTQIFYRLSGPTP